MTESVVQPVAKDKRQINQKLHKDIGEAFKRGLSVFAFDWGQGH